MNKQMMWQWQCETEYGREANISILLDGDHYHLTIFLGDSLDECRLDTLWEDLKPDAAATIPREKKARIPIFLKQNQITMPEQVARELRVRYGRA